MEYLGEIFPETCNTCDGNSGIWLIRFDAFVVGESLEEKESITGPWCKCCIAIMSHRATIIVEDFTLIGIENIIFVKYTSQPFQNTKLMEDVISVLQECDFS